MFRTAQSLQALSHLEKPFSYIDSLRGISAARTCYTCGAGTYESAAARAVRNAAIASAGGSLNGVEPLIRVPLRRWPVV